MSSHVTTVFVGLLYSSAHPCLAPSICRRLFTQAFDAELERAQKRLRMMTMAQRATNDTDARMPVKRCRMTKPTAATTASGTNKIRYVNGSQPVWPELRTTY